VGERLCSSASLKWSEPAAEIHPKVAHFLGRGAFWIGLGHALACARGFEKVGPRGRKRDPTASSAAMPFCTREASRTGGHWLRRKTNSLCMSFSLRRSPRSRKCRTWPASPERCIGRRFYRGERSWRLQDRSIDNDKAHVVEASPPKPPRPASGDRFVWIPIGRRISWGPC